MDRYEQFRRAATDRGIPDDAVAKFAEHLRFAIWLSADEEDEEGVGQKGGLPRLPVGMEWPSCGNGSPLPFIASVDCAVLPRAEGVPLPEDGSLLFFLHHEKDFDRREQGFARVVYVPAGTETVVTPAPPDHDSTVTFHQDIPFLLPEHRLTAWVGPDLPEWLEEGDVEMQSDVVQQLFADLEHLDELCEVVDDLWPSDECATFSIGGHCEEMGGQDGPWTQMAYENLKHLREADPDMWKAEEFRLVDQEERRLIREWVPLAQFPTQSDVYYGCFLISADDLAAKRFDRMRSFTMFTE